MNVGSVSAPGNSASERDLFGMVSEFPWPELKGWRWPPTIGDKKVTAAESPGSYCTHLFYKAIQKVVSWLLSMDCFSGRERGAETASWGGNGIFFPFCLLFQGHSEVMTRLIETFTWRILWRNRFVPLVIVAIFVSLVWHLESPFSMFHVILVVTITWRTGSQKRFSGDRMTPLFQPWIRLFFCFGRVPQLDSYGTY